MKSSLLAIRAIGAEFANRIYIFVAIAASVISVCLLGISLWLTTYSDWWWLLFALLIIPVSVVIGVLIVVKLVIRSATPPQSHAQKVQTKAFVDKLQRLSEATQTPKAILLFQIVRDIATPRDNGLIASISSNTASLKHDFTALCKSFE